MAFFYETAGEWVVTDYGSYGGGTDRHYLEAVRDPAPVQALADTVHTFTDGSTIAISYDSTCSTPAFRSPPSPAKLASCDHDECGLLECKHAAAQPTPGETPDTDADTSAASGRLADMLEELSADERTIPHDVYLALAARHIRRLLKKEDAAERRAAAAEAELQAKLDDIVKAADQIDRWRNDARRNRDDAISWEGKCRAAGIELQRARKALSDLYISDRHSASMSDDEVLALLVSDEAKQVPIVMERANAVWNARQTLRNSSLSTPSAPITDKERLDWLEAQARKSQTGISIDWVPSCEGDPSGFRYMRRHHIGEPCKTAREAIDAAMSAPSAKGATP